MYRQSFEDLQVDYIDYYLLHSIGNGGIVTFRARYIDNGMLDFLMQEREAGRIRNLGFSFHGTVSVFDEVLAMHEKVHWDFVQIQLNYVDWRHASARNVNAGYLYAELEKTAYSGHYYGTAVGRPIVECAGSYRHPAQTA